MVKENLYFREKKYVTDLSVSSNALKKSNNDILLITCEPSNIGSMHLTNYKALKPPKKSVFDPKFFRS